MKSTLPRSQVRVVCKLRSRLSANLWTSRMGSWGSQRQAILNKRTWDSGLWNDWAWAVSTMMRKKLRTIQDRSIIQTQSSPQGATILVLTIRRSRMHVPRYWVHPDKRHPRNQKLDSSNGKRGLQVNSRASKILSRILMTCLRLTLLTIGSSTPKQALQASRTLLKRKTMILLIELKDIWNLTFDSSYPYGLHLHKTSSLKTHLTNT